MILTYQTIKELDDRVDFLNTKYHDLFNKCDIDHDAIEDLKKKAARAEDEYQRSAKRCGELTDDIRLLQERVDGLSYHVEKLRNSSPKPSASSYNVGSLSTPDSISGSIILDGERYKAALEEILKRVDKGGQLARWELRNIAERALGIKSDQPNNIIRFPKGASNADLDNPPNTKEGAEKWCRDNIEILDGDEDESDMEDDGK